MRELSLLINGFGSKEQGTFNNNNNVFKLKPLTNIKL